MPSQWLNCGSSTAIITSLFPQIVYFNYKMVLDLNTSFFYTFVLLLFCLRRHDDGHFLSFKTDSVKSSNTELAVPNSYVIIFLASWLLALWSFFFKTCTYFPIDRDFSLEVTTVVCKLTISIDSIPSLGCPSLAEEQGLCPTCSPAPAWVVSSKVKLLG